MESLVRRTQLTRRTKVGTCIGSLALITAPILTGLASPASAAPHFGFGHEGFAGHEGRGGPGNGFDPGGGHGRGGPGNGFDPGAGGAPTTVNVTTTFFLSQVDISEGALGGQVKQLAVTLQPSNPAATYEVGTFSIGCAVATGSQLTFGTESVTDPVSTTVPGDFTLSGIVLSISNTQPLCGTAAFGGPYSIFLEYSGGSYTQDGVTYDLLPDSWGPVPVVPEGNNETSQTQQP
jgi:hypothetical protein